MSRPAAEPTVTSCTSMNRLDNFSSLDSIGDSSSTSLVLSNIQQQLYTTSDNELEMGNQSEQSVNACLFLELPGDVRNLVYNLVFDVQDGIHIDFDDHHNRRIPQSLFALSSTCRQINQECKDLPYWLNTFHFHVPVLEEPEQLAIRNRHQHTSNPIVLPLPQVIQSHYRKWRRSSPSGDLTSSRRELREKAQQFVTLAMRLPHIHDIVSKFERVTAQPMISRLRKVHVHLGSQTRHPFIERFFTAWGEVVPALAMLSNLTQLRISFELRISKRLSVAYEFGVQDADKMLAEMDACVEAEEFTLSELATLNGIRIRVWGVFFGTENAKPPAPFRPKGDFEVASGIFRSCGVAVVDRTAFERDVELRA